MGIYRTRKKSERRASSKANGQGDVVMGGAASKAHKWAIRALINKHGGLCAICGCAVTASGTNLPTSATVDHVVAMSKGGQDAPSNWQLACLKCNGEKGAA